MIVLRVQSGLVERFFILLESQSSRTFSVRKLSSFITALALEIKYGHVHAVPQVLSKVLLI